MSDWIRNHRLPTYFVLTYAITWTIWAPMFAAARGWAAWAVPDALYYAGSFGPGIAALVLTGLIGGSAGVRDLLGRIVKWRIPLRYYAFAVLVPVALFVVSMVINRAVRGAWSDLSLLGKADYLPVLGPAGVFLVWLLSYGLGEETGWRGFALPHLQRDHPATTASVILAVFWSAWHLPAFFFRDAYLAMGPLGIPMFLITMIFTAVVFTWLYNSTGGSILVVILFHAVFDWLAVSGAAGPLAPAVMTTAIIAWALVLTRRYGTENAAPSLKQVA